MPCVCVGVHACMGVRVRVRDGGWGLCLHEHVFKASARVAGGGERRRGHKPAAMVCI